MKFLNINLNDAVHYLRFSRGGEESFSYLEASVAFTVDGHVEELSGTYPELNHMLSSKLITFKKNQVSVDVSVKGMDEAGNHISHRKTVANRGDSTENPVLITTSFVDVTSSKDYHKLLVNRIAQERIENSYPMWRQMNILMEGDDSTINKMKEFIHSVTSQSNQLSNGRPTFFVERASNWVAA